MVVGEFTTETHLLVIGGGPAGYTAAFRAAELGVQTAIVDPRPTLGGVCLHDGCIPSKTLLGLADVIAAAHDAESLGLTFSRPKLDLPRICAHVADTVSKLAAALDSLCKKHKIERIVGEAAFENAKNAAIRGGSIPRVKFRRAIIATGSRPAIHPAHIDTPRVLNPWQALQLEHVSGSTLIVGDDYIALELATIYAALGSTVTLATSADRLLSDVDADLVRPLVRRLTDRITIHTSTTLTKLAEKKSTIEAVLVTGDVSKKESFATVILCTPPIPNTDQIAIERAGVKLDPQGCIPVDAQLRTADPRILAAGDVTGRPMLADKAIAQGRIAAEVIAGHDSHFEPRNIPTTIFTNPQIAFTGVSESQAAAESIPHAVKKIPWGASGRAVGLNRTDGLTKIIYAPDTRRVLGVGVTGFNAADLIAQAALAIEMAATLTDLAETIHPHPTTAELLAEAAIQVEQST